LRTVCCEAGRRAAPERVDGELHGNSFLTFDRFSPGLLFAGPAGPLCAPLALSALPTARTGSARTCRTPPHDISALLLHLRLPVLVCHPPRSFFGREQRQHTRAMRRDRRPTWLSAGFAWTCSKLNPSLTKPELLCTRGGGSPTSIPHPFSFLFLSSLSLVKPPPPLTQVQRRVERRLNPPGVPAVSKRCLKWT
jgi:hypothetical protein